MHTLPSEIGDRIGTSTLFAAWNAAIYVNQIEDERLDAVVTNGAYLEATQRVLQKPMAGSGSTTKPSSSRGGVTKAAAGGDIRRPDQSASCPRVRWRRRVRTHAVTGRDDI